MLMLKLLWMDLKIMPPVNFTGALDGSIELAVD
jgi:hypothetical protein